MAKKLFLPQKCHLTTGGTTGTAFFFKNRKSYDSPSTTIFGYVREDPRPGGEAKEYRLDIDPVSGTLTDVETPQAPDIHPITLRNIIEATEYRLRWDDMRRRESRRKLRNGIAATVVALAAAGGIYEGVNALIQSSYAAARRAELARQAFDRSNFQLPGNITLGSVTIRDIPPEQFKKIPGYKKHDPLLNARRFKLDEQTCKTFATKVEPGETVAIATSKTDLLQNQSVIAGLDGQHELVVCSTQGYPDQHQTWSLAVQLHQG